MSRLRLKVHRLVFVTGIYPPASALSAETSKAGLDTMQVAHAESPTRRRRVYQAFWKFRIGAAVRCGSLQAIVLARSRTVMGREIYSVWVFGRAYGRPYQVMSAAAMTE